MKNLVRFFLFLVILFIFASVFSILSNKAFAQQYVEKQSVTGANLLKNPGFESGKGGWTISGTLFTNSTTNAMPPGKYSGRFTLTSYSGTLLEQSVSDCSKLSGQNLEASIYVKSATSDISVCSLSGSTEVQCQAVSPVNSFTQVILNFPAPSSGSCGIRVKTTASVTGTPEVDAAYLGLARNIGTVAQARSMGSVKYAGAVNCAWTRTGAGSDTLGVFSADTDCSTPVVEAPASAPSTKIPGLVLGSIPPGTLKCRAVGNFYKTGSNDDSVQFAFSDGTLTTALQSVYNVTSTITVPTISGEFTYSSAQANKTIQVVARTGNTANTVGIGAGAINDFAISCEHFPTQSELAIRPQDAAFYVDANIAGANPDLGTSAVSSYTEITNGSLTLTPASGSAPVGIMCSSTNAAATPSTSPTTCSAGSESVGFNVNVPKAGTYEACVYFGHAMTVSSATISTTFQLIETPTNAQTITQESRTRLPSRLVGSGEVTIPQSSCGLFTFASSGVKGIRLMYEQAIAGTPTTSIILADESSANGQRNIRITMRPWLGNANAPLLVGSVTSNAIASRQIESASATRSGTCSTDRQSSDWYTLTSGSTGQCVFTYKTGVFTGGTPDCTCSSRDVGAGCQVGITSTALTTTTFTTSTGSAVDASVSLMCFAPR